MRYIEDYIVDGMLKSRGDYGDNTANLGTLYFSVFAAKRLKLPNLPEYKYLTQGSWNLCGRLLEVKPGILCRHPNPESWTSGPGVMSRDQIRPFLRAAKAMGDEAFIKRFCKAHMKRGFLFLHNNYSNHSYPKSSPYWRSDKPYTWKLPDFTGPSFWALLCRCLGWNIRPLFWLADLIAVMKSYQYVWESKRTFIKKGHKGDVRNHLERLMFNSMYYNTWFNTMAMAVFNRLGPQSAMDLWFSTERGEAPLGDVMRPLISRMFKNN